MKKLFFFVVYLSISFSSLSQQTPFEKSKGKETATYAEVIEFYKQLDKISSKISMKAMGPTDAGIPLHLVLVSNDGTFNPNTWHKENKVVILVNNGIHPGEPDGIDASMMLVRNIANNSVRLPDNTRLAFIPVYNIGGCLNRSSFSRVNQNGPTAYGFRGNSQNLDLNRDFTKSDSKEARSFASIFHYLNPDIQIDNHVSDGADYQHTMTLLTTQYDKLGKDLGSWLKETFEPQLYNEMSKKGWDMTPYVNFDNTDPDSGMLQFYDPPRYSSGFAALFQTMAFMPETHMLKPFSDRVKATYAFIHTMLVQADRFSKDIIARRKKAIIAVQSQKFFPLTWLPDSTKFSTITFRGYEPGFTMSEATGLRRMFYDRSRPFIKRVKYFNVFSPRNIVVKPAAYVIPQGWWNVIEILKLNKVNMVQLKQDSLLQVEAYRIDSYKPASRVFERHYKNNDVKVTSIVQRVQFFRGDYIIPADQMANRYIIEMLEPTGDDSFFAWNFFDAVLQQKEHYSDYRWEDIAADLVKNNPDLKQKLNYKKQSDTTFAQSSTLQLEFIYKNSPYYEPAHMTYPVYRLLH